MTENYENRHQVHAKSPASPEKVGGIQTPTVSSDFFNLLHVYICTKILSAALPFPIKSYKYSSESESDFHIAYCYDTIIFHTLSSQTEQEYS